MPEDFLFHSVSESEKEQIRKQAKAIMDSFAKKLEKVKEKIPEPLIELEEFEREEKKSNEDKVLGLIKLQKKLDKGKPLNEEDKNKDFRKRFFENAPNKNKDFILAEKKKW